MDGPAATLADNATIDLDRPARLRRAILTTGSFLLKLAD